MPPAPESQTNSKPPSLMTRAWRGHLRPLLILAVCLFAFRWSVLDWNVVPTGSMKPTIVEGDYILVNKLAYDVRIPFTKWSVLPLAEPQRGDIVVFDPPGEDARYVKRIVGVPGDVVQMRGNWLFVNGEPAEYQPCDETHVTGLPQARGRSPWFGLEMVAGHAHAVLLSPDESASASFGPVRVPAGHYFVLGDNRDNSKDSRYFGFVSRERILGKVPSVALSIDSNRHVLRWERLLHRLA